MLIAFLVALLIKTLVGGPEEIFMVPNLEKEIKSHVVDNERKSEILQLIKESKKEIKEFSKFRKNKLNEIKKMGVKREVTSEKMFEVYELYHNARLNLQSRLIENRLTLQVLFSDEEWGLIIENAVFPSEKARKKADKQEGKGEEKVFKVLDDIKYEIEKNIVDPDKRNIVLKSMSNFKTTLDAFIEEGHQMNYEGNNIVRNKDASRIELNEYYKKQNQLRYKGSKEYLQLRETALKNTNEKEWEAINKALSRLLKG